MWFCKEKHSESLCGIILNIRKCINKLLIRALIFFPWGDRNLSSSISKLEIMLLGPHIQWENGQLNGFKKKKKLEQIYFLLVKYSFVLQHCALEINK